jgi:hypothetical protein
MRTKPFSRFVVNISDPCFRLEFQIFPPPQTKIFVFVLKTKKYVFRSTGRKEVLKDVLISDTLPIQYTGPSSNTFTQTRWIYRLRMLLVGLDSYIKVDLPPEDAIGRVTLLN